MFLLCDKVEGNYLKHVLLLNLSRFACLCKEESSSFLCVPRRKKNLDPTADSKSFQEKSVLISLKDSIYLEERGEKVNFLVRLQYVKSGHTEVYLKKKPLVCYCLQ